MSLLTRGSVIALSLLAGGCVTSMLGGGSDAADAKSGAPAVQTAAATPSAASTVPASAASADQAWAGRDLPDYRTSSAPAAALSAETITATPAPASVAPLPSSASSPAAAPPARPAALSQDLAAATPPPPAPPPSAAPQAAPQPAPQRVASAAPPPPPPPAQPVAAQRPAGQQLAQAQQPRGNAAPQNGQSGQGGPTEEQLERAVQAYAGVSGGYYLNEKCGVLNDAQKREYEWHLSVMTAALSRRVRPDVLEKARSVTRQNVAEQFKTCDDRANKIVGEAFTAAQRMNQSITGSTYQGKSSDLQLALNKFGGVTLALTIERRCERIPEATRARVYGALDQVGSSLSKQGAAEQVTQIRSRATAQVDEAFKSGKLTKEQACDARTNQQLQAVLNELKRMQCDVAGDKEACSQIKS